MDERQQKSFILLFPSSRKSHDDLSNKMTAKQNPHPGHLKSIVLSIAVTLIVAGMVAGSTTLPGYCNFSPEQGPNIIPQPKIDASQKPELSMVVTVIRHGDRVMANDVQCWPGDNAVFNCSLNAIGVPSTLSASTTHNTIDSPSVLYSTSFIRGRNFINGNCNVGELTLKGGTQQIANGEMLRKVYVLPESGPKNVTQFLPLTFNSSLMYIRSDFEGRTIQSAQSLMLGFFPPSNEHIEKGKTQIRNLVSMDPYYDDMTPNTNLCPLLGTYMSQYTMTADYQEVYNTKIVPLMSTLSSYLNRPVNSMSDINTLYDCFNVHLCHNQPIPVPINIYQEVVDAYSWNKMEEYNYPTAQKFAQAGIGFLLQEIANLFEDTMNRKQSTTFALISGHDTTLVPILTALGVWDGVWTPYASMINFELYYYHTSGEYYVRVLYNSSEINLPAPCSSVLCPATIFFKQFLPALFPTSCV